MIEFYNSFFRHEDVKRIEAGSYWSRDSGRYIDYVKIITADGEEYSHTFDRNEGKAIDAARQLAERVKEETQAGAILEAAEILRGELYMIRAGISLLDKRQRRLWRRMKELHPAVGEEGDET